MQDFRATISDNDISGAFDLDLREKPRLTGTLSSSYLDLTERLQQAGEQEGTKPSVAEDEFLFSRSPLDTDVLQAADIRMDLDVGAFKSRSLVVNDVRVGIELTDGSLRIDPISFGDEGGSVDGRLLLTPSSDGHTLDASLVITNMHIGLSELPSEERALLPPISGELKLQGAGRSVHELMASSNGVVEMRQDAGRVKNLGAEQIFGDIVLTILRTLNPLREKQEYSEFDCGFYDMKIEGGAATIERFVVQTETMTTVVAGNVNLETEKIDVIIRAKPREGLGISIGGVANSFLKLGGTLKNPVLQVDPKGTVVSGGVAVATGGISLLAKGLFDRVSAEADICEREADNDK